MRYAHLFALAAASSAATTSAGAQETRAPAESRVRIGTARAYQYDSEQQAHRAALGIGTSATGTLRDTLGLMITSITLGGPAEKAGLEEGNRLAAINGVSLRVNAADVEDGEMSNALTRRLTRELAKSKPGDDVELRVYRDGRTQSIKLKTADADVLFKRIEHAQSGADVNRVLSAVSTARTDMENRPALGFSIGSTGSRRDTLGVLVMSVADSSPAAKAGIEEGNRIAAIGGVNLRVSHEDAGDRWLANAKAQRLQREIHQLKPGDNVTLKVYANGQLRDVSLKVARAGDLPRNTGGMMFLGGDGFMGAMTMPVMPPMPAMRMAPMPPMDDMHFEMAPAMRRSMEAVRVHLNSLQPQMERLGPQLERMAPRVQMELDRVRPQLNRTLRAMPRRARMITVIV